MEPLDPYTEQLDFPPLDEHPLFSASAEFEKTPLPERETVKIPQVTSSSQVSEVLPATNIQTDTLNNVPATPYSMSPRLLLPLATQETPYQSKLLSGHLQTLLRTTLEKIETMKVPTLSRLSYPDHPVVTMPPDDAGTTQPPVLLSSLSSSSSAPPVGKEVPRAEKTRGRENAHLKRSTTLLLLGLSCVLLFRTFADSSTQLFGPQGWAITLAGSANTSDPHLLSKINQHLHGHATKNSKNSQAPQITPEQYVDLILNKMSLEQKLGQMMIVQFIGDQYSVPLSAMISQYNIGSVLIFKANSNIQSASQLKGLIQQMQQNSQPIPLAIAIDQEGGAVDRLVDLDGPRPSEATIGGSNDPARARTTGAQDAQDLASYGINLNLAPVVDVTRVYNAQMATRTYGSDPTLVTQMAAAYLQGLQQSGKVLGTIKHFPGLGDVSIDPHVGVPVLNAPKSTLEQVDWAPYRALIQQHLVHVVMVTHEIVTSVDPTQPSTLSSKVVTGILRNDLGFQGVIITDSLSMSGVTSYVSEYQAAADAIAAGADIVMGAASPEDVEGMFNSIKQAIANGTLSTARIDASVRRILLMKYEMGLLSPPSHTTTTQ